MQFETTDEIREPVELHVTGKIPSFAAGTLYRVGTSTNKVDTYGGKTWAASHWFDGFSHLHRFVIEPDSGSNGVKVTYNSRRTTDELIERIRKRGEKPAFSFGQKRDPCQSLFKKVMSTFVAVSTTGLEKDHPSAQNVGVTLSVNFPGLQSSKTHGATKTTPFTLTAKTDASFLQSLDPEILEPVGIATQATLHPELKGPLSAAHSKSCPITGDVYNYNLDLGSKPTYRIFSVSASTGKTTILAMIKDAPPAYLHSFFLTATKLILCVWGSHYSFYGLSIIYHRNLLDSIAPLDPSQPCRWYVVDRTPARQGVVAVYESDPFFCFHSINAYEVPSANDPTKTDIIADSTNYSDASILKRFYYENMTSTSTGAPHFATARGESCRGFVTRHRLTAVPELPTPTVRQAIKEFEMERTESVELPFINPAKFTLPYRYVYGASDTGKSSFLDGLAKVDLKTQRSIKWQVHGHSPSEPIFVATPGAVDEDDGVLLSVVLDGFQGKSYLLCLDAKDMTEMGRASVPAVIGLGFHGVHVPKLSGKALDY